MTGLAALRPWPHCQCRFIPGTLATPTTGPYGASKSALEAITDTLRRELILQGIDANQVAGVIGKALTAQRPRTHYLVGRDAVASAVLARLLPDRMIDRLVLLRQMLKFK